MNYNLAKNLRTVFEKNIHLTQPQAILNEQDFPWRLSVQESLAKIQREAREVLLRIDDIINFNEVLPNQRALKQDEQWKSFFLIALKKEIEAHTELCPETTKAIRQIPGVINAFFSILRPGVHIPPHRGPYAGILRYHLGVIIPEGDTGIKVDGSTCHWKEGGHLFFDDSFEHEAWNHTNETRVILFVDIERPLPGILNPMNKFMLNLFYNSKAAKAGYKRIQSHCL